MKPRLLLLTGSHLLVLVLAYGIARENAGGERDAEASRAATKASGRGIAESADDGAALLANFMEQRKPHVSAYDSLKASLPVAADPEAAAKEAIRALASAVWPDKHDDEESDRQVAEAAVRVLHWMRQSDDPGKVLEFLRTDPGASGLGLLDLMSTTAMKDMAAEQGILKSWRWLLTPSSRDVFAEVAVMEMKAGGGLDLIARLEASMEGDQMASFLHRLSNFGNGKPYYQQVGAATRFEERQALFEMAMGQQNQAGTDLLIGFARSSEEAARWLLEQNDLDPRLAERLRKEQNSMTSQNMQLDYDRRLEAMQHNDGQKGRDRQALLNELLHQDLDKVLNGGRDWRYEFRHGVASLDDIMAAVRTAMPHVPAEGEEAFVVSLYRQLVEEDSEKARPLLDTLPEDKRREALFDSTWMSMVNINPDEYLDFFSAVPEPETAKEKDLRTKGWNWKARGFLMRYGDDYVEWVKEMPEGIDKETAMNSLIWATREQNPAEARKLSEQLYPPKANEPK